MLRFAVIGNPIAHSKSPEIHQGFASQFGIELTYERVLATKETFNQTVLDFFAQAGRGLNITSPFKGDAYAMCDWRCPYAEEAKAVNTLLLRDEKLCGHNTDGLGLRFDLEERLGFSLSGKKLLMIGAGGAVRGVMRPLIDAGIASCHIINRDATKAEGLADTFKSSLPCSGGDFTTVLDDVFDIAINSTPATQFPLIRFTNDSLAYDMRYTTDADDFLQFAAANGAKKTQNGLGMLYAQAAEAFYLWHDVKPAISF